MMELAIGAAIASATLAYVLFPVLEKAGKPESSDLENVELPQGELDGGDRGEEADER